MTSLSLLAGNTGANAAFSILNTVIIALLYSFHSTSSLHYNGEARSLKGTHIKGRLLVQAMISFSCIPFQMGTSLKGKNLRPEGANSFHHEQFLIVLKITFITLSDLLWMLLFLLRTCVCCVMGATAMQYSILSNATMGCLRDGGNDDII